MSNTNENTVTITVDLDPIFKEIETMDMSDLEDEVLDAMRDCVYALDQTLVSRFPGLGKIQEVLDSVLARVQEQVDSGSDEEEDTDEDDNIE